MKIFCSFFLFFFALSLLYGQQEERISWEDEQDLSWADFKGEPPGESPIAAITASGISYEYNASPAGEGYELDYKISTFFYPNKSWYRPESCDDNTLRHEQLHFDISELFARKMRSQLRNRRFSKNVKTEVRQIFRQINQEMNRFQQRYDEETDYSRNRAAQDLWNQQIQEALDRNLLPR